MTLCLESIPQEILEHIAFHLGTSTFLGPPSDLASLVVTNHNLESRLSVSKNHTLYSKIFTFKFDLSIATRRLGMDRISPPILAEELQRRCVYLKRLRSQVDATFPPALDSDDQGLRELLFYAYLTMLENEGRNERQLREYGHIDLWLQEYWFSDNGRSSAKRSIKANTWPSQTDHSAVAMWLFWFLLRPEEYTRDGEASWNVLNVLKLFALGAHRYHLTSPSWLDFIPPPHHRESNKIIHYSEIFHLNPPPLASPAILCFLTLVNRMLGSPEFPSTMERAPPVLLQRSTNGMEWECEWGRCINLGQPSFDKIFMTSFMPGSIEGVWEGIFTYTEFTAYASLLAGAPPPVLQKSLVVKHRQTWKLREHHLLAKELVAGCLVPKSIDDFDPLSPGDPLRSYFPTATRIKEDCNGLEIEEPGGEPLYYKRARLLQPDQQRHVCDIIITGEGHSAWGQFSLVGRVRPCDGFISLSKDYVDGDRGKWLYRGYLIGNVDGNLAGRWRDTLSPVAVPGYEGCFTMSRRR
ncbi:uncharacterized protein BT62DRAFT_339178 [Guyanagaster necrorhizus]|uniref:F-box domain-containing protein n=1 Tax=Guyanagaster necrorhizus TaxID=856835 RepID=A0A9P7VM86_9AGAR|nr:uncharacterized protein BT62DRAFT_339178 [Guyanagaster necrorhizus MCA 3950]KAG7443289.1 hypothetical protein BT62DRAFT_339178 [Guyanagaster necrorhizus MCA 3950]